MTGTPPLSGFDCLEWLVGQCARALFADLADAPPTNPRPTDALPEAHKGLAGLVEFTGDELRGTVVLAGAEPEVRHLAGLADAEDPQDWLCEMANQLTGRLKNQLLRRRCVVYACPPELASARETYWKPVGQVWLFRRCVHVSGHALKVWVDIVAVDGFLLGLLTTDVAAEGELVLF